MDLNSQLSELLNTDVAALEILLDCIGEGIIVVRPDGGLLLSNKTAESIFGIDLEFRSFQEDSQEKGIFLTDQVTPFPDSQLPLRLAVHGIETNEVEMFIRNPAISQGKYISVTGRPISNLEGEILGGIVVFRDVTEHRSILEELRQESTRDSLTGLYNRRYFDEHLQGAVQLASRHETPLCLAWCDLDHFKAVNDQLGHQAGDRVLTRFARLLRKELRVEDLAFRLGGDEFAVVFQQIELSDAEECMDRLRKKFGRMKLNYPSADTATVKPTVTVGIAELSPARKLNAKQLMEAADEALYEAKERGRNMVVTSSSSIVSRRTPSSDHIPPARR